MRPYDLRTCELGHALAAQPTTATDLPPRANSKFFELSRTVATSARVARGSVCKARPTDCQGDVDGDRYGEVVQRHQGFWFHPAERRRQGCLRSYQRGRAGGSERPQRGPEGELRDRHRARPFGRGQPQGGRIVV